MAEVMNGQQQANLLLHLSQQDAIEARRLVQALYGAWRRVYSTDDGKVILKNLCLILLNDNTCAEDEGEKRLVRKILKAINVAYRQATDDTI